ncbi:unnamed protein product [Effrenium voratum]|nr:unnamed protein product [Effrenium voratum]
MSVTDSEANFRARAQALGLENNLVEKFVSAGINSLAKFAFSSNYVPGAGEDTPFVDAIQTVLDRDASLGELATLRRLHHEAYAMSAAELKLSVERCDETGLKRLTQPERAERLKKQQTRLTGLRIVGRMEPADRLVDTAVSQYEENRLAYIELSKCICKEQEILAGSSRDDKQMAVDSSGIVRLRNKESKVDADLSTDLLLRQAFMRRALAYDQANVLGYLLHDQWIERLFESRVDCPPEGYAKISQQQVVNADRRLFVKLAELTRSGIQLTSAGRPVDLVFEDAMNHPDVLHLLQPLPSTRTSEKRATEPKNDDPRKLPKAKSKGKSIRMPQGLENGAGTAQWTATVARSVSCVRVANLQADCPGNHEHAPFGRKRRADGSWQYATSEEAAYPRELCIACNRADLIKTWSQWACELSNDEKALKRGMEPGVRSIMNDKKILLLQKIAVSLDWPDMDIFDSLINGFSIVGDQKPCGIFDLEPRPAGITIGELDDMAKFVRPALLGKVHASQVDDDLKTLWEATIEEAGPGWEQVLAARTLVG